MKANSFQESKILVADDDKNTVVKIREILEVNGCQNVTGISKISSLRELEGYELVILDIMWLGDTKPKYQTNNNFGVSAAKYLRESLPNCKIILMSKYFYELNDAKEISQVCDDFFSSREGTTDIFRTIIKVFSASKIKFDDVENIFSKYLLLARKILCEVEGDSENKPSLVGISNQVHTALLREINTIIKSHHKEYQDSFLLKTSIDNLSASMTRSIDTISKSFLELLQEIKIMINDPKVQMNFFGNVAGAAGSIEKGDLVVYPSPKTSEEAAKEIQDLLSYLQQSSPPNIETAINQEIIRNPTFGSRLRNALKAAGLETAKIIFAPLGIGIEAIRGWRDAE